MYNPKHSTPRRPGRPLSSRKALFALVSVLVLIFAAVGVTVAYLQTQTEPLENQFTPAKVSCKVEETFDGNVKSNVTIRNTGDTDAFIRRRHRRKLGANRRQRQQQGYVGTRAEARTRRGLHAHA